MNFTLRFILFFLLLTVSQFAKAQSSDELFKSARAAAFDEKNYPKAIAISKQALEKSPDYADIRVFLGRLYTWSKYTDSARTEFNRIISKQPTYEDAYVALGYLEYWNDNSQQALLIVNNGIKNSSASEPLLLLKAKILNDLKNWKEADLVVNQILKQNPQQTEARALATRIRDNSALNRFGVTYDFVYFDKQFDDPWHLASVDYGRQTKLGSVIGRVNYANRFKSNGIQFEVDAYPRISNTFQAYVSAGYSPDQGIFPSYRAGFSLYANLPLSLEAEAGFRYLRFSDNTWIYTASLGKYYKNFWFNLRTYLTPSNEAVSQSFSFNTRYYFGGADDFLSLGIGTGLSPDNQQNNVLINTPYKLKSNNISVGYRKSFKSFNIITLQARVENQEYLKDTKGNQFDFGIGYIRRF